MEPPAGMAGGRRVAVAVCFKTGAGSPESQLVGNRLSILALPLSIWSLFMKPLFWKDDLSIIK